MHIAETMGKWYAMCRYGKLKEIVRDLASYIARNG